MKRIILALPKSAWDKGRIGRREHQDWYRGLVKAISLSKEWKPSQIFIPTGFQVIGDRSEAEYYTDALKSLGVDEKDYVIKLEGCETIEQIDMAIAYAKEQGGELVIVSAFLHYWRVRWLCRDLNIEHHCVFGWPRPREVCTDIALVFLFPLIDVFGQREWYLGKLKVRRQSGTF